MKGNPEVLDYLNVLLAGELASRDQYFIHSSMYLEWGYMKLHKIIHGEMEEETGHAQKYISRILLLEGQPKMVPDPINIGTTVPEMLQSDLNLENKARDTLKKGIKLCEEKQDYVSRDILVEIEDDEEDHIHWLEKQIRLIKNIGLDNYLQSHLVDDVKL